MAMYQRMQNRAKKVDLLAQCVSLIISNNLHPDPTEGAGLGLTPGVFYNVLKEAYSIQRDLFDRLFAFAETLEEFKTSTPSLLLRLAYVSAGNRDFDTAIRMARDVAITESVAIRSGTEAEFQSLRLLCLLCKGTEKQQFQKQYVDCLKSRYEPKTIDGADLEILIDLAEQLIKSKKPKEALTYIQLAKEYKPLIPKDQIPEFAAVLFYEMVALKRQNLNAKLIRASQETLAFIECLPEPTANLRLASPEGLKNIEKFARDNLEPTEELFDVSSMLHGIITASPKYGRNQKVSVRYPNGKVVTDKFKRVQDDLAANRCVLVEG
jgi:hypothetical protein